MAEAGLTPVAARSKTLAACFLAKSLALPRDDPLRTVGETTVAPRLRSSSSSTRKEVALFHLTALPQCAIWVWTDGSADDVVLNGGAGAFIEEPGVESHEIRVPAGKLCSSFRVEMFALQVALSFHLEHPAHLDEPIVICTDSQSALAHNITDLSLF